MKTYVHLLLLLLLLLLLEVFSPRAGLGRDQSSVRRLVYIYIFLNYSYNEEYFRQSCRESQNTRFMFNNFSPRKSYLLWNNVEEYSTARQTTDANIIRRMHISY